MRWLASIAVLLVILGASHAELSKDQKAEAKRLFLEGTKAYNLAEYQQAITAYRAAYSIVPEPSLLFNIAQAYRQAGDLRLARTFYKNYLNSTSGASNRRQVEEKIAEINDLLAKQDRATNGPPTAPMDPEPRPTPLEPKVVERPPEKKSDTPAPVVVLAAEPPAKKPIHKRWWLWTAVGGVVLVGVAVGVAVALTSSNGPAPPNADFGNTRIFGLTMAGGK